MGMPVYTSKALTAADDDIIAASRALRHGYLPSDQLKLLANATGTNYAAATTTPASPSRGFYVDDGHYATDVRTASEYIVIC